MSSSSVPIAAIVVPVVVGVLLLVAAPFVFLYVRKRYRSRKAKDLETMSETQSKKKISHGHQPSESFQPLLQPAARPSHYPRPSTSSSTLVSHDRNLSSSSDYPITTRALQQAASLSKSNTSYSVASIYSQPSIDNSTALPLSHPAPVVERYTPTLSHAPLPSTQELPLHNPFNTPKLPPIPPVASSSTQSMNSWLSQPPVVPAPPIPSEPSVSRSRSRKGTRTPPRVSIKRLKSSSSRRTKGDSDEPDSPDSIYSQMSAVDDSVLLNEALQRSLTMRIRDGDEEIVIGRAPTVLVEPQREETLLSFVEEEDEPIESPVKHPNPWWSSVLSAAEIPLDSLRPSPLVTEFSSVIPQKSLVESPARIVSMNIKPETHHPPISSY